MIRWDLHGNMKSVNSISWICKSTVHSSYEIFAVMQFLTDITHHQERKKFGARATFCMFGMLLSFQFRMFAMSRECGVIFLKFSNTTFTGNSNVARTENLYNYS